MIAFLNLGNEEKSTLAGSEFHTFTILSVKKLRRFGLSHCALYKDKKELISESLSRLLRKLLTI